VLSSGKDEVVYESCTPLPRGLGFLEGSFTFVPRRYVFNQEQKFQWKLWSIWVLALDGGIGYQCYGALPPQKIILNGEPGHRILQCKGVR
jgi:hypothetical protein